MVGLQLMCPGASGGTARRIANLVDTCTPPRTPIEILHLGGGALGLVRYVQATRPGSVQVAVEIERELPGLVTAALPLPPGTVLEIRIGDAREQLAAMGRRSFDVIVLDVFCGESSPPHLTGTDVYAGVSTISGRAGCSQ